MLTVYFTVVIGLLIYFLPAFVALKRNHANRNAIAMLNLLAGWTVIGWIGSMVWAMTSQEART